MESSLIITSNEKSFAAISELFRSNSIFGSVHVRTAGEGRRILMDREFNIVFISSPLGDENGQELARQIAVNEQSQVILAVRSEIYEPVSAVCEADGVFTIEKPINRDVLRQLLSLAKTMHIRLMRFQSENENLKQRIEDIRILDRAKNILISSARMSEHEAHRYIEKKAMDSRVSKRTVSERIIHDYENGP